MPRMRTTWIRYFLNWLSQAPFTLLINTTTLHVQREERMWQQSVIDINLELFNWSLPFMICEATEQLE